jgi:3-dehydroquinate synthase II
MSPSLQFGEVAGIEPIGDGMRVCLDLADVMDSGEGVLVGDSGHGFLLVLSENQVSATYPARPFRVNCGAIHHYLVQGSDQTIYLSELRPEMSVNVLHAATGAQRQVPIGRIKMEKRPLLRVILDHAGQRVSATLQDASSVRLQTKMSGAVNVQRLTVGEHTAFIPDQPGRHLGQRIEEEIREV